jgi:phospholipid/cholesterol/gamma-HCH transport system ATP-binding protein
VADPDIAIIEDLSFAYDRRPVLHGIQMRIPRGKVVAVMGQSGCGKTTLLRVIAAALLPTQGRARVLGQDTRQLDRDGLYALRRRMGMLFQFGEPAVEFGDLPAMHQQQCVGRHAQEVPVMRNDHHGAGKLL